MKAISLNPSRICIYQAREWSPFGNDRLFPRVQVANNSRKKAEMSKRAQKRIREAVNWLCFLSRKRSIKQKGGKFVSNFSVSFITLTLPGKQMHSHKEIKEKCLHQFITQIGKYFPVKNYVWKAELQKNGNIHFHLTTDVFIHHMAIRKYWNQAIEKLGYVSAYADTFRGMEFEEYDYWRRQQGSNDTGKNLKAYLYGNSTGWKSPNTTDVKQVKDIDNLAAYLSKYLTKDPVNQSKGSQGFSRSFDDDQFFVQDHNTAGGLIADSAAELIGRLWFCSRSISALGSCKLEFSIENQRFINLFRKAETTFHILTDWAELFFFRVSELPAKLKAFLTEMLICHAMESRYPFPSGFPAHGNQIQPSYWQ